MSLSFRTSIVAAVLVNFCFATATWGRSWQDNGDHINWGSALNWSPINIPQAGDDIFIGDLAAAVGDSTVIDQNFSIGSLALTSGADADTAGNVLDVDGNITISGAGTTFIATQHAGGPAFTTVMAEDVTISASGAFSLQGGRVVLGDLLGAPANVAKLTINANSFLSGYGVLRFDENLGGVPTVTLFNDGVLQSRRPVGANNTDRFTLTIEASDTNARHDIDGIFDIGVVSIDEQTTLDLQVETNMFHGTMNFEAGSILELSDPLLTDGATFNIDAGFGAAGVPRTAIVRGNRISFDPLNGGDSGSQFNVNSGTIILEEKFDIHPNSEVNLAANTSLVFQRIQPFTTASNIDGQLNFNGTGTELVVDKNHVLNIELPSFDWDGPEDSTTTINSSTLRINSNDIETGPGNSFDGTINFNAGSFEPNITGGWSFSGVLNTDSTAGTSSISSTELMTIDGGSINVDGGLTVLALPTNFTASAASSTAISSGSTLRFEGNAILQGGSTHTGAGTLQLSKATLFVNGNQIINMPSGTVNLDEFVSGAESIQLTGDLTINANSLGPNNAFGDNLNASIDAISINNSTSTLAVNLTNPAHEWTLAPNGRIVITGGATPTVSLAGSDLNIQGEITVTDSTLFTARVDLEAGGLIRVNTVGKELRFSGGNAATPNTIAGGTIQGSGEITANGAAVLVGHGTIDTNVRFLAGSDLLADNGTLIVNGTLLDADILGTADLDGTLQLGMTLNTANVSALQLNGGFVTGQSITNNGVTEGFGAISTVGFTNNGTLRATGDTAGGLTIDTTGAPDLDGTGITGVLEAVNGNMRIVKSPTDAFGGDATVGVFRFLFFDNDWTLGTNGTLNLNGGLSNLVPARLSVGGVSNLNGTINVSNFGRISGDANLGSTLTVVLPTGNDVLVMDEGASTIATGTTFTGFGSVVNSTTGDMTLADGFDSAALILQNDGDLHLGSSLGQIELAQFEQTATGTLFVELANTGTQNFDSLSADFNATLAGTLDVTLTGGFMPNLGEKFTIVTGDTARFGTFNTENLPTLGGGNMFAVNYKANSVELEVIASSLTADFDNDGDVDGRDFLVWQRGGTAPPLDPAALALWQASYGTPLMALSANVPEPSTSVMLLMEIATMLLRHKQYA
ncbi:beta strand repeat-containing protein [Bythopirellula goksoeyrii]|uniref:Autotransporter-associated beta strand repeat protein n=1 Tax=Bythopirellula goksoeyrii TaxID=1400387 RepID=A0A5B9Q7H4_9BACT|nr:hypothetical protein [Bythopirellula goksoeyrii]QEG33629.1 hypothetical protein Pr1d_08930 [Bythopirellula goksoeyrii]